MTGERLTTYPDSEAKRLLAPFSPVGIDLDGVFVNSVEIALKQLNQKIGSNFGLLDVTHSYRLDDLYSEVMNCSLEEANQFMNSVWHSRECMEDANPVLGAIELVRHLDTLGVNYYFVTSRPSMVRSYTQNWFTKNGLEKEFLRIIMQSSETYNRNHKSETINSYGIKIHFEDMAEHATKIVEQTSALVVLVNYPANENLADHKRIIRPKNRKDYGNILSSYNALLDFLSIQPKLV